MRGIKKILIAGILGFATTVAMAAPKNLITHNTTDVESNAKVGGIFSPHPTKAHSDNRVSWFLVSMACIGHTTNGKCGADIYMETNTATPKLIGSLTLDLNSGDISPKHLEANGYAIDVTGLGETRLSKL